MAASEAPPRCRTPPPDLDIHKPAVPDAANDVDPKPPTPSTPRPTPAAAAPAAPESVPELDPDPPSSSSEAVDMEIFSQILELDEDGTHDFSKEMVAAYFAQATTTFDSMDTALAGKQLPELSQLGHFLKGSSAALGISKVQAACEKMQHYGELRDEDADKDLAAPEALSKIDALLVEVKAEYARAEKWLKAWYAKHDEQFDEP